MACSCNNTLVKNYWIIHQSGVFYVTQPISGGAVVTQCNGSLVVNLTVHDCARLVFTYQPGGSSPSLLPLAVAGDCPCEVSNASGAPPPPLVYEARFKPPLGGSCTHTWVLQNTQPTCRITIIVSKS